MGSSELLEAAEQLRQQPGVHWKLHALALALSERAQHLARSSKSLGGDNGIWCLRDVVRKLTRSSLLDEKNASQFLRFFDNRAGLLSEATSGKLHMHELRSGISGQPLLQHALHIDLIGQRFESSAEDLRSSTRLFHKNGLLEDDDSAEYLHYLDNRIRELQQYRIVIRTYHVAEHHGLCWLDLRKGIQRLQGTCEGLKGCAYQLRSSLKLLHSLGFITDEEVDEHCCNLDTKISKLCEQEIILHRDSCGARPHSSFPP
jgi:hypothetical protein